MHHGVRFMVVAPSSTIDMNLASGDDIPIEERDGRELLEVGGKRVGADVEAFVQSGVRCDAGGPDRCDCH